MSRIICPTYSVGPYIVLKRVRLCYWHCDTKDTYFRTAKAEHKKLQTSIHSWCSEN